MYAWKVLGNGETPQSSGKKGDHLVGDYYVAFNDLYKKEVDFVAIKRDEKLYIQVSDSITDEKTFQREVSPLLSIKDAYPKMLIARTRHDAYQYEGIKIIDFSDWLTNT